MIRVLQVLGNLGYGGAETMVMNLYRAIDRSQIQFDFIVHTQEKQAYYDEIMELGGKVYFFPAFNGKNLFDLRDTWAHFFSTHPEYKVLHSHVRSYASVYLPIAKKYGVKTIIHSHSTSNGRGLASVVKAILQYPLRFQADYLFTCSQEAGNWLFGKNAQNKDNYHMIPNGVDCKKFAFSEKDRMRIRNELGIALDAKVIGHVGRFHEAKNHSFLIQVFYEVLKKGSSVCLVLVGDGGLRTDIENQCAQLGIIDKVVFAGSQSNTAPYYSAFDLFLFPSRWEGLPVSVVEAQAAGLPCLMSDTVTSDVCLTDLVKPYSLSHGADKWAQRVVALLANDRMPIPEEMQPLLTSFDVNNTARELQAFYLNL